MARNSAIGEVVGEVSWGSRVTRSSVQCVGLLLSSLYVDISDKDQIRSLDHQGPYLFTFCPPGPEDRLYEISQSRCGMVLGLNLVTHCRHAAISSSVGPLVLVCHRLVNNGHS